MAYYATRGKLFAYPEEKPDFVLPERYKRASDPNYRRPGEGEGDEGREWQISAEDRRRPEREWNQQTQTPRRSSSEETVVGEEGRRSEQGPQKEKRSGGDKEGKDGKEGKSAEEQRNEAANKAHGADPVPGILKDDCYIVTWYSDDDPDNPLNWSVVPRGQGQG